MHLQWTNKCWNLEAVEEGHLIRWVRFSFASRGWLWPCALITWGGDGPWMHNKLVEGVWCSGQCFAGRPRVWPFMWTSIWYMQPQQLETMYVHPFMAMVFPDGSGLFQQDNVPCHTAHSVQEWHGVHEEYSRSYQGNQLHHISLRVLCPHKENQHHIRRVVRMFWLMSVWESLYNDLMPSNFSFI